MTLGLRHFQDPDGLYKLPKDAQLTVLGFYASQPSTAAAPTHDAAAEGADEARARHAAFRVG